MGKKRNRYVFVVGGDHNNTLAVVRSLGVAGYCPIPVIVSEQRKSFVAASRYVRTFRIVFRDDDLVDCLRELHAELRLFGEKPKVICCSDGAAVIVDASPWVRAHFSVPGVGGKSAGKLSRLMGKEEMTRLAEMSGFLIPKTFLVSKKGNENIPDCPEALTFPCIIKPDKSFLGSKHDFRICKDLGEWNSAWDRLPAEMNFLVQPFLENVRDGQLLGVRLRDGRCVLGGSVEKPICCPETHNLGMAIIADFLPDAERFVRRSVVESFLGKTGYVGPFSIEFLISGNSVYFVEINFRTDGNFYLSLAGGVNLPEIWCDDVGSEEFRAKPVRGIVEISYLKYIALKKPFRIIYDFLKADTFAIFSLRDPLPFFAKLFSKIIL